MGQNNQGNGAHDGAVVTLEMPARADRLALVRQAVEELAVTTRLSREQTDDLLTAVDEAVANAIRHGSSGEGDTIRVTCEPSERGLTVRVRDGGRGFAAPHPSPEMPTPEAPGGRGLPLMCALSDSVEFASTPAGTTVTLRKHAE
jgi:anti-sigma regulatory factor (Ser/Thr protein kinase)